MSDFAQWIDAPRRRTTPPRRSRVHRHCTRHRHRRFAARCSKLFRGVPSAPPGSARSIGGWRRVAAGSLPIGGGSVPGRIKCMQKNGRRCGRLGPGKRNPPPVNWSAATARPTQPVHFSGDERGFYFAGQPLRLSPRGAVQLRLSAASAIPAPTSVHCSLADKLAALATCAWLLDVAARRRTRREPLSNLTLDPAHALRAERHRLRKKARRRGPCARRWRGSNRCGRIRRASAELGRVETFRRQLSWKRSNLKAGAPV